MSDDLTENRVRRHLDAVLVLQPGRLVGCLAWYDSKREPHPPMEEHD